jgi:hypothetical protein
MASKLPFSVSTGFPYVPMKPPHYYPSRPCARSTTPSTLRQLMEGKFVAAPFKLNNYRGFIELAGLALVASAVIGACGLVVEAWGIV